MKKITLFVLVAMTLSTWLDAYDSLCSEGKWCQFSHYPTGVEVDLKSQLAILRLKLLVQLIKILTIGYGYLCISLLKIHKNFLQLMDGIINI